MKDFEAIVLVFIIAVLISTFGSAHADTVIVCTPDRGCEPVIIIGGDDV